MDYRTVELRVTAGLAGGYRVELSTGDGQTIEAGMALELAALERLEADAEAYGRVLGAALFGDPDVGAAYRSALDAATRAGTHARIRLRVDPPDLARLTWERLCHRVSGRWVPIGIGAGTPFSRYVPRRQQGTAVPIAERPVRILAVISSPSDVLDAAASIGEDERRALHEILDGLPDADVTWLESGARPPTLRLLRRTLEDEFHIVHFLGHGRVDEGGTALLLEPDGRSPTGWTADADVIEALGAAGTAPQLCFLAACSSGAPGDALLSLAHRAVLEAGVPAAVGMSAPVDLRTARQLAETFYQRLLTHGVVDRAMNEARESIRSAGDWDVPALFLRPDAGALVDVGPAVHVQAALVASLRKHFVGRAAVIEEIRRLAADPAGPRHILVEAPAGTGKSALMARLVELERGYIFHFVRAEDQHEKAGAMLHSLCAQLARAAGEAAPHADQPLAALTEEYLRLRAKAAARLAGRRLVFVIDGLDEGAQGEEKILLPKYFDPGGEPICYVLSFRSGTVAPAIDLNLTSFHHVQLGGLEARDVCELFALLGRRDLSGDEAFAARLVERTGGEAFYLRFLVEDLAERPGLPDIPPELPADSRAYIARQVLTLESWILDRLPAGRGIDVGMAAGTAKLVITVLSVAADWLARRDLASILHDVPPFTIGLVMPAIRRYFVTARPADLSDVQAERYLVMPVRLREALLRACTDAERQDAQERLAAWCRRWSEHRSAYAFHHLPAHLAAMGRYEELLATLTGPFPAEKAAALGGWQATLPDYSAAVRLSIERKDPVRTVHLLMRLAAARRSVEGRSLHGGIALDASRRLYDAAQSAANRIGDLERRFTQYLVIATVALRNGDLPEGAAALDAALPLEIEGSDVVSADLEELAHLLIVRYRDVPRAAAVLRKINQDPDAALAKAVPEVAGADPEYAERLARQIEKPWNRVEALIRLSETLARVRPDRARAIWDELSRVDRGPSYYRSALAVAGGLATVDRDAALAAVRAVIAGCEAALAKDPSHREAAQVLNEAVEHLAAFDLAAAYDLALDRCPEVIDSLSTQSLTIASILARASASDVLLDLDRLAARSGALSLAEIPMPDRRTTGTPSVPDILLNEIAVQAVLHGREADARALAARVENPWVALATWIDLAACSAAFEADVSRELAGFSSRVKEDDLIFKHRPSMYASSISHAAVDWYRTKGPGVADTLAAAADPEVAFKLLLAIRATHPADATIASRAEAANARRARPTELAAGCLAMAEIDAGRRPEAAARLLEQAIAEAAGEDTFDTSRVLEGAIPVGMRLQRPDLVGRAVEALYDRNADSDRGLEHLARLLVTSGAPVERRLFAPLADAAGDLLRARLVLHAGADWYVRARVTPSAELAEDLYTALASWAAQQGLAGALGQVRPRLSQPLHQAYYLASEAALSADPAAAARDLARAWSLVLPADAPAPDDLEDTTAHVARHVVEKLAAIDAPAAAALVDRLPAWERHLAWMAIGQHAPEPRLARTAFARARDAALENDVPVNRLNGLVNVGFASMDTRPGFGRRCLAKAVAMLPETDPAVRVAYHVRAMLTPPEWPAAYLRSIWKRLAADLAEVEWKARQRQRIFDMAANIAEAAASARFWTLVADALLARDRIRDAEYEAHDMAVPGRIDADDLAAAAVTVARFGDRGLATALIEAAEARVEEGDPFGVRPDIAAGYRAIGDRRGPVVLAQVLAWLEDLLDRRPPSFISVNFTVSQAIATLADQYDGLAADEAAMAALLRNCAAIDDLGARTDALESLAAAAARAAERSDPANDPRFTQAARIVAQIPIAPRQADALRLLLGTLAGGPATGADPAVWAPLLDVAERTVEGTVECAKRWALNYVREAADAPGAEARVAELLVPEQ